MNGKEKINLRDIRKVGLDTNIFIYHLQNVSPFKTKTDLVFEALVSRKIKAITSVITKAELLSYKQPLKVISDLNEQFESTPNLTVYDVDDDIAVKTAELRRKYNFRLPDAIQLATAISAQAGAFLTNDEKLKKCKEITVIVVK